MILYIYLQERIERGNRPLLLATLQHGNPCHPSLGDGDESTTGVNGLVVMIYPSQG